MLFLLDSSPANQAAHFLSRLTPGWLLCANCAQRNDMSASNYFYHPHKSRGYETLTSLPFTQTSFFILNACVSWPIRLTWVPKREISLKKLQLEWEILDKESIPTWLKVPSIFSKKQIYTYNIDNHIFF